MIWMIAVNIAKNMAEKNPLTEKPLMMLLTNITINTVMIKEINPKVRMFKGKVKNRRIVPTVALAKAINRPAKTALQKPETSAPGTTYAANITASPVMISSMINLIIVVLIIHKRII